jgi:hypothetical protein
MSFDEMTSMSDGAALNRALAEHVAEVREQIERGRLELERQKQLLNELHAQPDEDAAT